MKLAFLLVGSACGLQIGAGPISRARAAPMMQLQSMNPFENLMQMADQRIAKVSHCMLAAGTDMTLAEANAKIEEWKKEIGNDEAKFAEVAMRESECKATAAEGGMLGIFARGKLGQEMDNLIFKEDVVPIENGGKGGEVRGPLGTNLRGQAGLSLIYVHTCWEPMSTGVVGALFDPPDSLKKKVGGLFAGGDKKD